MVDFHRSAFVLEHCRSPGKAAELLVVPSGRGAKVLLTPVAGPIFKASSATTLIWPPKKQHRSENHGANEIMSVALKENPDA